ncbi:uncharacterized protein N7506_001197 [Penicillium brevicompactum]|uniref:uncharacterized protein n=1 Tax=Penicillium brevicompactum TaxID=5074 RepID=UPI00253FB69F|nr:uncharacterized protein N7506_001197 [Penicillium brevicompactum]KAJ5347944.1 hypothetical protein N7506_001197 [Penicillium brevicompactum]
MSSSLKRRRLDEDQGDDDRNHPPYQQEALICVSCEREPHEGDCSETCPNCDRRHRGKCTAFCRRCAGIGHKWLHCPSYPPIPKRPRRNRRRNRRPNTYIGRVMVNVPVVNERPITSPEALNDAILAQMRVALRELEYQGVPMPARVIMSNVNISTNLITRGVADQAPAADSSLLDRVQRATRVPRPTHPTHPTSRPDTFQHTTSQSFVSQSQSQSQSHFDFTQTEFARPTSSTHTFGRPSFQFGKFTFSPSSPNRQIPGWPRRRND